MFITPAEALRRYDVSKPTLYSDMAEGKLSFRFDDRKKRKIDVAELDRIYEKRPDVSSMQNHDDVKSVTDNTRHNVSPVAHEIERLQQEIGYLKREIQVRQSEAEKWQEAFDKAQATADKITALLENKSGSGGGGEWEKALKALEDALLTRIHRRARRSRRSRRTLSAKRCSIKPPWKRKRTNPCGSACSAE